MAKFYYRFWKRMLESVPEGFAEAAIHRAGTYVIDNVLVRKLFDQVPDYAKERLRGISDVSNLPMKELATSLVLPDLLPLLEGVALRFRPKTFIEVVPPPRFGCSSFISAKGPFLHGRNLDFPGVAYWDRFGVIQMTEAPGSLRYIGFTTAGAPLCGITGVNEAQISVSLHQHYCRISSWAGQLPFVIGEKILSEAKTLEEARRLIESSRVASSWAFVVTDGKKRDGFIYETHARGGGYRPLVENNGVLSHTNYFQSSECRPVEFATTARMNWDNYCRRNRLADLVEKAGEKLTPQVAASILSDHYDPYWGEEKILNRTISQVYNIQSIVLDSERMRVWMAEGDAPVHLRRYVEFDLGEIFAGREGRTGETTSGYQFSSPAKREAKEKYILSFVAAFDGDFGLARQELQASLDSDFAPEASYVAGVLALRMGELDKGVEYFERARSFIVDKAKKNDRPKLPPEYFESSLFLARAFDLKGDRGSSTRIYREVAEHPDLEDSNIRNLARQAKTYTRQKLARILMPYSSYIPFE